MINRIVVIGNGFDLAHGMKTSYKDFFAGYWDFIKDELIHSIERHNSKYEIKDKLCTISLKDHTYPWYIHLINNGYAGVSQLNGMDFYNRLKNDVNVEIKPSPFFERICRNVDTKNWVDIENEYYQLLKKIALDDFYSIDMLNVELDYLKEKLIHYLEGTTNNVYENCIKEEIMSPLREGDMSMFGKKILSDYINDRFEWSDKQWKDLIQKYSNIEPLLIDNNIQNQIEKIKEDIKFIKHHRYLPNNKPNHTLTVTSIPDRTIILNFNYTDTISRYVPIDSPFLHINIHGSTKHIDDAIFGYGDELDEDFKKIENLNDNRYLNNLKSIGYLESDKYSWLLEVINSAPYQVFIMGHSCGNSDRTLLNTLFEHENCISIKLYYYEYKDSDGNIRDNYKSIVQNIYRNFTNKADIRDKVVNKRYCEPLIPLTED